VASPLANAGGAQVFSLVLGASGASSAVYYGANTSATQGDLRRYLLADSTVTNVQNVGLFQQVTPVLGAGGLLYTATSNSDVVSVREAATLQSRWMATLEGVSSSASPTLDCARAATGAPAGGNLGVLYVPAGSKLYALIVDSPGLDGTAPWPKYQRDARNSGNPATPITSCP
jgi:hypothetical protein